MDMLEAIDRILQYTESDSSESFSKDTKTQDAVIRNLEILGESAKRVPDEVKAMAPDIEWSRIIRSRHILVHDYFRTDLSIVWRIVSFHLPSLREQLMVLLEMIPDH